MALQPHGSYDDISAGLARLTTDVVLLDRVLPRYGPEAAPTRAFLREAAFKRLNTLWSGAGLARVGGTIAK